MEEETIEMELIKEPVDYLMKNLKDNASIGHITGAEVYHNSLTLKLNRSKDIPEEQKTRIRQEAKQYLQECYNRWVGTALTLKGNDYRCYGEYTNIYKDYTEGEKRILDTAKKIDKISEALVILKMIKEKSELEIKIEKMIEDSFALAYFIPKERRIGVGIPL